MPNLIDISISTFTRRLILIKLNIYKSPLPTLVVPLVLEAGLEPARSFDQRILSPQRLPFRHSSSFFIYQKLIFAKMQP